MCVENNLVLTISYNGEEHVGAIGCFLIHDSYLSFCCPYKPSKKCFVSQLLGHISYEQPRLFFYVCKPDLKKKLFHESRCHFCRCICVSASVLPTFVLLLCCHIIDV